MTVELLQPTDVAGGTYSLALVGMLGTAVLLFLGTGWVSRQWKLPVALAGLVALIAAAFYLEAREAWAAAQHLPVIYRYIDWLVTVPIQVLTLYFFIAAVARPPVGLFWRLLVVAVVMILARYMGEVGFMHPTLGFLIGIVGWLYILGEVCFGKLGEINSKSASETVQTGFFWLRLVVTVGWAIYPLCYFIASFAGGIDDAALSIVYNLADFVNRILFALIVLYAALRESVSTR
ncbi:Bacteriorhodopsin-like protein [Tistlia consotensis]|uniref:Bacteriorhodopsin-like protein n=1 Tax=Tistlia consotensis USBA 355 TaxID=560819 RepID=A0A1Y6C0J2_9PROT|nr:bacteriorhodopsin [Tistlia consotensis]SMF29314.1 Bacteriorhodopsin-like protein [Tistlia consotensis USBA 355]SNR91380.1 Bacteriorhodopsin-like protein [Tistlia consotensis]